MRHIILLLILFISTNIFSQNVKKINYQLDGGVTFAIPYKKSIQQEDEDIGFINSKEFTSSYSYFFECLINYNFNQELSLISGLNYHQNKFNTDVNIENSIPGSAEITSTHIQIPILLSYSFFNKLSLSAGPYLSFLLSSKEKSIYFFSLHYDSYGYYYLPRATKYDINLEEEWQNYDIGLTTQINYTTQFKKSFSGLVFSRFNYGFIDQLINENQKNSTEWAWKNINLMIGIGIRY